MCAPEWASRAHAGRPGLPLERWKGRLTPFSCCFLPGESVTFPAALKRFGFRGGRMMSWAASAQETKAVSDANVQSLCRFIPTRSTTRCCFLSTERSELSGFRLTFLGGFIFFVTCIYFFFFIWRTISALKCVRLADFCLLGRKKRFCTFKSATGLLKVR